MRKKILIIRLSSIGDIILTTPIIQTLRNSFPNDEIDFLIDKKFSDILTDNPNIDNLILYDKNISKKEITKQRNEVIKNGKYDLIIDLHNNFRSRHFSKGLSDKKFSIKKRRLYKLALVYLKKTIGRPINIVDNYYKSFEKLCITPSDNGLQVFTDKIITDSLINFKTEKKYIAVAPGAAHFTKRMPINKFIELVNMFDDDKFQIVLLGGKDDVQLCSEISDKSNNSMINLSGKLSIRETAAVIKKCCCLISNDTAVMHLGAAAKIPIAAIFGSTVKEFGFTPYKTEYKIFETNDSCRPCTHIGRKDCPKKHFNCMNRIDIIEIYNWIIKKAGE